MAEHGTDPDDGDEHDDGAVVAGEGAGAEVPESVPDAYPPAAGASAALRGEAAPDA